MKQIIMYVCEKCGKQSRDKEEILKCEAAHFGLTPDEMKEWQGLESKARQTGAILYNIKTEQTEKAYDEAIDNLMTFEKAHGLFL